MAKLNMVQAIQLALDQEMAKDKSVVLVGEDIGKDGGVFRCTDGLIEKYGEDRVLDTPIAESAIIGSAIGMSMAGLKPVAEVQFSGFAYLIMAQLEGHAGRYRTRTQGVHHCPLVVRMPYGGGVRALEHHSESREAYFAHTPGVKVVLPSGPRNARALLVAAIRDPDPVIFMEPKRSYRSFKEEVPDDEEVLEIGKSKVIKEGKAITVVSYGAMLHHTQHAIEKLEKRSGITIELIDLLTIAPMDSNTVIESVKKTGRCVVVTEAMKSYGVASEIIARINDKALLYLEAPVKRISHYDVVTPGFGRELLYIPSVPRIERGIEETLAF